MYIDNSDVRLVTVNEDESVEILFKNQTYMDIPKERVEIKSSDTKTIIEYDLPIQGKERCEEHNKMCREMYGDKFTPVKPTEEHIDILFDKIYKAIEKVGDAGGWYLGDGVKVKIELEYEPEDK